MLNLHGRFCEQQTFERIVGVDDSSIDELKKLRVIWLLNVPDEFVDVIRRSTLAERRPVDEPETIRAMLEHADLIVTARSGDLLVGVSRAITDFAYCTYLSDLAVDVEFQK